MILLDSADSKNVNSNSYLFVNPIKVLSAYNKLELEELLQDVENYRKDYFVSGYLTYEASYFLEKRFASFLEDSSKPIAWFGVYEDPYIFDHSSGEWNRNITDFKNVELAPEINSKIEKQIEFKKYSESLEKIKEHIKAGDVYQINFTYDVKLESGIDEVSLYSHIRSQQKTQYCSFIKNEFETVASFSPELFFRINEDEIITRPMKGTARRGVTLSADKKVKESLYVSEKDRAENLMIVDLLRNDIGKICNGGSVKVDKLFNVETYPTVHQMTSTVVGTLCKDVAFPDIIRSIFPCGSVTGAPKIRAMEIIHSLEEGMRGVYCGAIGFLSPKGDAEFSVPIRTLCKDTNERQWNYRVGSGVVWDSEISAEWKECEDKTKILQSNMVDEFSLVETILLEKGSLFFWAEHMKRLKDSAEYFSFDIDLNMLDNLKHKIVSTSECEREMIRILLSQGGTLKMERSEVIENLSLDVTLSERTENLSNPFLFHKTTIRSWYDNAMLQIKNGDVFDVIFVNSKGEVAEGARSNVFVEINGELFTPPVKCGLLPGILRQNMIANKQVTEKIILRGDLKHADRIFCGNSVRGLVEVNIKTAP